MLPYNGINLSKGAWRRAAAHHMSPFACYPGFGQNRITVATRDSRKRLVPPAKGEQLGLTGCFTDARVEETLRSVLPSQMEDEWFVYIGQGVLTIRKRHRHPSRQPGSCMGSQLQSASKKSVMNLVRQEARHK